MNKTEYCPGWNHPLVSLSSGHYFTLEEEVELWRLCFVSSSISVIRTAFFLFSGTAIYETKKPAVPEEKVYINTFKICRKIWNKIYKYEFGYNDTPRKTQTDEKHLQSSFLIWVKSAIMIIFEWFRVTVKLRWNCVSCNLQPATSLCERLLRYFHKLFADSPEL